MNPIYYLISHYGGYFSFDVNKSQFLISEKLNENIIPVVYHHKQAYFFKNEQLIAFHLENGSFHIEDFGIYVQTYINNRILCEAEKGKLLEIPISQPLTFRSHFLLREVNTENLANETFYKEILQFNPSEKRFKMLKLAWLYWEQPEKPELILTCYERFKQLNPELEIHFLDISNIHHFLPLDVIKKVFEADITPTLRSDIIRLELLYRYGGIWVDSSIIFNQSIENILGNYFESPYEIITFYDKFHLPQNSPNAEFPIFENWFIAASPHSEFIRKWLSYLLPALEIGSEGLLMAFKADKNYEKIRRNFDELYFLAYLAQQMTLIEMEAESRLPSILAFSAYQSAFYYQGKAIYNEGWGFPSNFLELASLPESRLNYVPKLIKLTRNDRDSLTQLKAMNICVPHSFLYSILYPNK